MLVELPRIKWSLIPQIDEASIAIQSLDLSTGSVLSSETLDISGQCELLSGAETASAGILLDANLLVCYSDNSVLIQTLDIVSLRLGEPGMFSFLTLKTLLLLISIMYLSYQ